MRRFATYAIGTGGLAGAGVFAVFISIAPGVFAFHSNRSRGRSGDWPGHFGLFLP